MSIRTTLSVDGSVFNFELGGAFDINLSLQMQDLINTVPKTVKLIRINMLEVAKMDASIFTTLLLLHREKNNSTAIEIINCDRALARRLSISGLDRLLRVKLSEKAVISQPDNTVFRDKDQTKSHQ